MTALLALLAPWADTLALLCGSLAVGLAAYLRGRAVERRAAEADRAAEALRQEVVADEVAEDVGALPDPALRERLRDWSRPARGHPVRAHHD